MKQIFCLLTLLAISLGALAQYTYEGNGFYVRVVSVKHVQIGFTTDSLKFYVDDDRKMDVEVYEHFQALEGYGDALDQDEIADPDFYVNSANSEISTMEVRDARRFIRALSSIRNNAQLRVDVVSNQSPKGKKHHMLFVPSSECKKLSEAYRSFRKHSSIFSTPDTY